jgi:tripartite ATP-independent transporter DctM subunit
MNLSILFGSFAILVLLGVPISFAMGLSSLLVVLILGGVPLNMIVHRTVMGVDSYVLLAIPLFIFAGTVMEHGGISERLVRFARMLIGRFRGGLAMGVVLSSMLIHGVSGSMVADVSAICAMMLGPLERTGYARQYSLALIGTAGAFSNLIPPSILMIVVAAVANVSVIALFTAGLLPSVVLGVMFIILIHVQARIYGMPRDKASSLMEVVRGLKDASLALGIPIIIFGGIRLGIATVTEMAAITVVYALLVAGVIYRNLTWKSLLDAMVQTAISTGLIAMLLGFAMIFGYLIATEGVPQAFAHSMREGQVPAWGVLVITALIFVFIGSVLEGAPAVLIFVPILLPLVRALGIDLLQWLVIVVLAASIGLFMPPTGIAILVASNIGKVGMEKLIVPMLPFMGVLLLGLIVLILFPTLSTIVPRALELPY